MPPQRCTDSRPHGPHRVPARGTWTSWICAGHLATEELDRLEVEAFSP